MSNVKRAAYKFTFANRRAQTRKLLAISNCGFVYTTLTVVAKKITIQKLAI